jgi:hypothetical protein
MGARSDAVGLADWGRKTKRRMRMSLARQPLITEEELAFGVMGFAMGPLCISEYLRDVTEDWHKIEGEEYFHNRVLHVNVPDWHIPTPRSPIHRSEAARIIVVPLKEPSVSGERVKSALTPFDRPNPKGQPGSSRCPKGVLPAVRGVESRSLASLRDDKKGSFNNPP